MFGLCCSASRSQLAEASHSDKDHKSSWRRTKSDHTPEIPILNNIFNTDKGNFLGELHFCCEYRKYGEVSLVKLPAGYRRGPSTAKSELADTVFTSWHKSHQNEWVI